MIQRLVAGGFLIIIGIIVATSGVGITLDDFQDFNHEYPYEDDWSLNGSLTNLEQNNQDELVLVDDNSPGVYASDTIRTGGELNIDSIVTDTEGSQGDNEILFVFETLTAQGAVIESLETEIEDDLQVINTSSLEFQEGTRPEAYHFTFELVDNNEGTPPQVNGLTVSGSSDLAEADTVVSNLNQVLGILLVGLGFIMILTIFLSRNW